MNYVGLDCWLGWNTNYVGLNYGIGRVGLDWFELWTRLGLNYELSRVGVWTRLVWIKD